MHERLKKKNQEVILLLKPLHFEKRAKNFHITFFKTVVLAKHSFVVDANLQNNFINSIELVGFNKK